MREPDDPIIKKFDWPDQGINMPYHITTFGEIIRRMESLMDLLKHYIREEKISDENVKNAYWTLCQAHILFTSMKAKRVAKNPQYSPAPTNPQGDGFKKYDVDRDDTHTP